MSKATIRLYRDETKAKNHALTDYLTLPTLFVKKDLM